MSLGLVGKTGLEVLAHRHEPLLNLHVLGVGRHYRSVTSLLMLINKQRV